MKAVREVRKRMEYHCIIIPRDLCISLMSRLVQSVLEEELKTIHAFSQKTLTPAQWAEKQA